MCIRGRRPQSGLHVGSGQLLVAETLAEGLVPLFPVGCGEVAEVLPEGVGGVALLLWQAVIVRPARATAANLRM